MKSGGKFLETLLRALPFWARLFTQPQHQTAFRAMVSSHLALAAASACRHAPPCCTPVWVWVSTETPVRVSHFSWALAMHAALIAGACLASPFCRAPAPQVKDVQMGTRTLQALCSEGKYHKGNDLFHGGHLCRGMVAPQGVGTAALLSACRLPGTKRVCSTVRTGPGIASDSRPALACCRLQP